MKTQTLSFSLLLIFSFMLILAGSYLSSFQSWLVFTHANDNNVENQPISDGGIRSISSSTALKTAIGFVHSEENNRFDGKQPVASLSVPEIVKISSNTALTRPGHSETSDNSQSLKPLAFPAFIEYADELIIEFPEALASKVNLKRAISKVLLTVSEVKDSELLSFEPIKSQYRPLYYKRVKNQYGKAIRYPADARAYAEFLLKKNTEVIVDSGLKFTVVHIPLVEHKLPIHVEKYRGWVNDYAKRFNVSSDLVFAIMDVESGFNPKAVSDSNALGLMQIKSTAAGKDVYNIVDNKAGNPSQADLFNPQENIRIGVAYMGLLNNEYLKQVRNQKNREMLLISSYNGGLSKALKLFGDTPSNALQRINQLHPKNIYRALRYQHPSDETKRYLDKVLNAKIRYQSLLS